jgi:Xaa-Pro aminopeptidase
MKLRGDDAASLQKIAMTYINTHGKDLHGEPLGKYYVHGLGHHVGLKCTIRAASMWHWKQGW